MATIIRVDFATRTVAEVAADEPTDFSTSSLEELLREAEDELLPTDAGAPDVAEDETTCPICGKGDCPFWRNSRGPKLTLVT